MNLFMPPSEARFWMSRTLPHRPYCLECCEVVPFAVSTSTPGDEFDPCLNHAGWVRRCARHSPTPPPRTWIADIPLYRLKLFLRQRAVFDFDYLRRLLPKNHPEYRA